MKQITESELLKIIHDMATPHTDEIVLKRKCTMWAYSVPFGEFDPTSISGPLIKLILEKKVKTNLEPLGQDSIHPFDTYIIPA